MSSGRNQEAMAFDPGIIMLETHDLKQKIDGLYTMVCGFNTKLDNFMAIMATHMGTMVMVNNLMATYDNKDVDVEIMDCGGSDVSVEVSIHTAEGVTSEEDAGDGTQSMVVLAPPEEQREQELLLMIMDMDMAIMDMDMAIMKWIRIQWRRNRRRPRRSTTWMSRLRRRH